MDIVKELVDDNEVNSDKIGTSVYFWSFPSETANRVSQILSTQATNFLSLTNIDVAVVVVVTVEETKSNQFVNSEY
jgi:hypothetical protein